MRLLIFFFFFVSICSVKDIFSSSSLKKDVSFDQSIDNIDFIQLREYGDVQRKLFVIAAYIVRSFLATQKESYIGLQVSLCQLRLRLKTMIKNNYREHKKKDYLEYQAFKNGLVSTCIVYYILIYFSRYYFEEYEQAFVNTYIHDSFLYTFLYDTTLHLDLDFIDQCQVDLRIREKRDEILNLEYPSEISFTMLGLVCANVPKGFQSNNIFQESVRTTIQKLINRVFTANSGEAYSVLTLEDLAIYSSPKVE